jgi:hypothetical protein
VPNVKYSGALTYPRNPLGHLDVLLWVTFIFTFLYIYIYTRICVCVNCGALMAHMLNKRGGKYCNYLGYDMSSDYSSRRFGETFLSYLQRKAVRLRLSYPANKDCHSSKLRELFTQRHSFMSDKTLAFQLHCSDNLVCVSSW